MPQTRIILNKFSLAKQPTGGYESSRSSSIESEQIESDENSVSISDNEVPQLPTNFDSDLESSEGLHLIIKKTRSEELAVEKMGSKKLEPYSKSNKGLDSVKEASDEECSNMSYSFTKRLKVY